MADAVRLFFGLGALSALAAVAAGAFGAHLLRERYGWRGELRAFGDIWRDQLFFLASCGFDSFSLREGEDPHLALAALSEFSESYQGSVREPLPLFRRRSQRSPDGKQSQ